MPQGDLASADLEWWAYIADVLTFYNERSINGACAHRALDADVRAWSIFSAIVRDPASPVQAVWARCSAAPSPVNVPAGSGSRAKPAPGKQPQTFETTPAYALSPPDAVRPRRPERSPEPRDSCISKAR